MRSTSGSICSEGGVGGALSNDSKGFGDSIYPLGNTIQPLKRVVQGGSLARFTNLKKWRITVHGHKKFGFPNHENKKVRYSTLFNDLCLY